MSDEYEHRARKGLDDLVKLDPELAQLDREETIKEVAAGLKKAETAWGGPGSQWPGTWELMKAPFTGELNGVEVERGLWPFGIIALKLSGLVIGPIFGLLQWVAFWNLSRRGLDARIIEGGVATFSKRKGPVANYSWSEIAELRRVFEPPLEYWELILTNGNAVPLHLAEFDPVAFHDHGITVHASAKFRHEYGHDG